MYNIQKINQAPIQESLKITRFSHKNLHTDNYINSLTSTERKIYQFIDGFRNQQWIKFRNEYIANKVGCSIRTVIRTTNKFNHDGFITKYQEHKYTSNNYIIVQSEYVTPNLRSSLNINLFINPSLTRVHARPNIVGATSRTTFKKTKYPEKGEIVNNFKRQSLRLAKSQVKLINRGGHSPAIVKPMLPLEDQIHTKKVDIAFFEKQLEKPEDFWDPRGILFSANITMTKSLLARARLELIELEGSSNEKQRVLYQNNTNSMATCSA